MSVRMPLLAKKSGSRKSAAVWSARVAIADRHKQQTYRIRYNQPDTLSVYVLVVGRLNRP